MVWCDVAQCATTSDSVHLTGNAHTCRCLTLHKQPRPTLSMHLAPTQPLTNHTPSLAHLLLQVYPHRPTLLCCAVPSLLSSPLPSPQGPGCCDFNKFERVANVLTSFPYAAIGVHSLRCVCTCVGGWVFQ